jgi:pimeloyl-ACP methyl ester carboxylesterase
MRVAISTAAAVTLAAGGAFGWYAWNNTSYARRDAARVHAAGYLQRSHTLSSGINLAYAEGPDNGPPVLLLHAQTSAWQTYNRVLPGLAWDFHVFAIDLPGHGASSRTPTGYDVHTLTAEVAEFARQVIGQPAIVSGHSSGGLIAAQLAAEFPELAQALLFEDPPFFSTDPDRAPRTFNYVDLATPAHEFVHQDVEHDFTSWYLEHNAWIGYFGRSRDRIVSYAKNYRRSHPDRALNLWFAPPKTNEVFAHLNQFDPAFADAFYTFSWQQGFDQAATLSRVHQPAILVHANWRITEAGILEGAMTDEDAARASALMRDCNLERVATGHGFHVEKPAAFVDLMQRLAART